MERRKHDRRRTNGFLPAQEDRRRGEQRQPPSIPERIPPRTDPGETIERLVSRRQVRVEAGDVVILREPVPRLQPSASAEHWWFRVRIYPGSNGDERVFTSFHHAASHGEQLASQHGARLIFVEDQTPTMLNDYRP